MGESGCVSGTCQWPVTFPFLCPLGGSEAKGEALGPLDGVERALKRSHPLWDLQSVSSFQSPHPHQEGGIMVNKDWSREGSVVEGELVRQYSKDPGSHCKPSQEALLSPLLPSHAEAVLHRQWPLFSSSPDRVAPTTGPSHMHFHSLESSPHLSSLCSFLLIQEPARVPPSPRSLPCLPRQAPGLPI